MQKIREAFRLHSEAGMSVRQICVSVGASVGTVQSWLAKARQARLEWPLAEQMSDEGLGALIYGDDGRSYRQPDWEWIHQELKIKGVTRQLLFEEYQAQGGQCYRYSRFFDLYSKWLKRQKRSMRQVHKGGEKAFVNYSGKTVLVFDGEQSVWRQAQIFVGVLGASNYTYAEATWSQSLEDWLGNHTRMVEFFGGVSQSHRATAVLSQLSTDQWYNCVGDNTLADGILDRLMHNAHRIVIRGESMRKRNAST